MEKKNHHLNILTSSSLKTTAVGGAGRCRTPWKAACIFSKHRPLVVVLLDCSLAGLKGRLKLHHIDLEHSENSLLSCWPEQIITWQKWPGKLSVYPWRKYCCFIPSLPHSAYKYTAVVPAPSDKVFVVFVPVNISRVCTCSLTYNTKHSTTVQNTTVHYSILQYTTC